MFQLVYLFVCVAVINFVAGDEYTVQDNFQYFGGIKEAGVSTVDGCKEACNAKQCANGGCVGFDFDRGTTSWQGCYLFNDMTGKTSGVNYSVDHYRRQCSGGSSGSGSDSGSSDSGSSSSSDSGSSSSSDSSDYSSSESSEESSESSEESSESSEESSSSSSYEYSNTETTQYEST